VAEPGTTLVLSAVVVWELRLKWHSFHISGGRKRPVDPAAVVTFAAPIDWELLSLTARHAAAELTHALGHKDPFDEWLLVQAQGGRHAPADPRYQAYWPSVRRCRRPGMILPRSEQR
jgi:PIN domain nuclease of toxin-antitoxin system